MEKIRDQSGFFLFPVTFNLFDEYFGRSSKGIVKGLQKAIVADRKIRSKNIEEILSNIRRSRLKMVFVTKVKSRDIKMII